MNPFLKKLGFDPDARVVILHADDIGMCQASVDAYADLLDAGIMSSAATMVPCPWFPAAAESFRHLQANPRFDVGVHLTLNSEWDAFRWSPLSTHNPASGLIDDGGYFHSRSAPTQEHATPHAVESELTAQVERALASGFAITHMDTHMLTLHHPRLLPSYVRVAEKFRLPAFLLSPDSEWKQDMPPRIEKLLYEAQERGMPLFDHFDAFSLSEHTNRLKEAQRALNAVPKGLSAVVFHPVRSTPEVRAMTPDWHSRVADHRVMMDDNLRKWISKSGIQIISYRQLRDATFSPSPVGRGGRGVREGRPQGGVKESNARSAKR